LEAEATFDVFLSHAHVDAALVERLGIRLSDEAKLNVWLDRWVLVPGEYWQQKMAKGPNQARCCAVCIGTQTSKGWFRKEIERALNKQVRDPSLE
jgi:TIR domain